MSQRETISGEGPWKVVFYDGVAVRVEIQTQGRIMVIGQRDHDSTCARCGAPIKASTPTNEDLDCCESCEDAIEAGADREV